MYKIEISKVGNNKYYEIITIDSLEILITFMLNRVGDNEQITIYKNNEFVICDTKNNIIIKAIKKNLL